MPIAEIRDIGRAGVVSDVAPWDLPPAAMTAGINFRLSNGKVQTAGGTEPASPPLNDTIGHIVQSTDFGGDSTWLVCGSNSIAKFDGVTFEVVGNNVRQRTSVYNAVDPVLWSSSQIGEVTFFNHPDGGPLYWTDTLGTSVDLNYLPWHIGETVETWAEAGKSCKVLRSHKNFLFALGMTEFDDPDNPDVATTYDDKVYWSHPAEPNGIPFSWKPTYDQADSLAGFVHLGRGGSIIGGESLRDSFVIYSEEAINVLDFTGGPLIWNRRTVSSTAGLASKESLVEVNGIHYFISHDDIMAFDGNQVTSLLHGRLRTLFADVANPDYMHNAWATHNPTYSEIWFAVPVYGTEHPQSLFIYNYRDNTWSMRDLEGEFRHARFGDSPNDRDAGWDDLKASWGRNRASWLLAGDAPFDGILFGAWKNELHNIDPEASGATDIFASDRGVYWDSDAAPVALGALRWNNFSWDSGNIDALGGTVRFNPDRTKMSLNHDTADNGRVDWEEAFGDYPAEIGIEVEGVTYRAVINFTGVAGSSGRAKNFEIVESNLPADVTFDSKVMFYDSYQEVVLVKTWEASTETWDTIDVRANYKRRDTVLTRTDMPILGMEGVSTITRIYPLVNGTAPIQIRVGSQQQAGGPVKWAGDFRTFLPSKDRKIDVRTTGELHAYEIKSKSGEYFDFTGMDIEFTPAGQR